MHQIARRVWKDYHATHKVSYMHGASFVALYCVICANFCWWCLFYVDPHSFPDRYSKVNFIGCAQVAVQLVELVTNVMKDLSLIS
jgi:2-iminoacetate synthase ThiH